MYFPKSPRIPIKVSMEDSNEFIQKFLEPGEHIMDPEVVKLTFDQEDSVYFCNFYWTIITKISWLISKKETYYFNLQGNYTELISGDRVSRSITTCSVIGGEIKDTTRFNLDIPYNHEKFNNKMTEVIQNHVGSSSLRSQISWMKKEKK